MENKCTRTDKKTLVSMFSKLLLTRMFAESVAGIYPEWEMRCPCHFSFGQEAIPVGVCENLGKNDAVFGSHRSHAHYLAKGGDMNALIAEFYGKKTGCAKGRGGSMHLIDLPANFMGSTSIVAGTIPIAAGVAFGRKLQEKEGIVAVFFGDGATDEGVFAESINFAALKKLPILFVCENNQYAVYTHVSERQPPRPITDLVRSYGILTYTGDGNDAEDVFEVAKRAIQGIRSGKGPAFIEYSTYRMREHCGPLHDEEFCRLNEKEFMRWKNRCPLEMMRKRLIENKVITEEQIKKMEEESKIMIEKAIKFAKDSPFPDKEDLGKHVYAD
ncbi:MAG: thiamine pyrophosphate-dependent dehydrogenase E1 component subunit alpha [Candidatus Woesearchaeota archaeon]|nr:thiamine pyrophosphate-dependent dehydrogenase E1 component subunit alpha [Candidatus Woesearchaeota archaeon]